MQVFINKFQKGSQENQNLGTGAIVGFDTYSKKGVLRLAKKSTLVSASAGVDLGSVYPTFIELSAEGGYIWAQMSDGSVIYSSNGGTTWQPTATPFPVAGNGNGMIMFGNFMHAFTSNAIYVWKDSGLSITGINPTSGSWGDGTNAGAGNTWKSGLQSFATDPINALHFPFLYPNSRGVYFGNGTFATSGDCNLGLFAQNQNTLYNPGGVAGTDYLYNGAILNLPSYTYTIGSINFLPPSKLAISLNSFNNPSQGSDLITWDTVSLNKFDPPLRFFSDINATTSGNLTAGIKQLWNRNQVLYAITGGNHAIYNSNGTSLNCVEDISLYCSIRDTAGSPSNGELDLPVYFNSFPSAISFVGNKLLTGTAPMTNNTTSGYPPANSGFFPIGVWSLDFNIDGSHATQCEFINPNSSIVTSPSGTGNMLKITCIKSIPQNTSNNSTGKIIIGFTFKSAVVTQSGFQIVDLYNYVDNLTYSALESELFEVGTYLSPKQIGNIEINFVKKLKTGQTFDLAYRVGVENGWTLMSYEGNPIVTGDNTKNSYSYTSNDIGAVQFVQFRFRMATDSGNPTNSPELKTIIINPLENNG